MRVKREEFKNGTFMDLKLKRRYSKEHI